jgi:hypothetical protein
MRTLSNSFTKPFDGSTPSSDGAYWDGLPDHSWRTGRGMAVMQVEIRLKAGDGMQILEVRIGRVPQ